MKDKRLLYMFTVLCVPRIWEEEEDRLHPSLLPGAVYIDTGWETSHWIISAANVMFMTSLSSRLLVLRSRRFLGWQIMPRLRVWLAGRANNKNCRTRVWPACGDVKKTIQV